MATQVGSPAPDRAPRDGINVGIVGSAIALALIAAAAAQLGVPKAQPLVGAIVILGIGYAFSTNRGAIDPRTVAWGLSLQIVFALIVLDTTIGQRTFATLGRGINRLLSFSGVGAAFVFGPLGDGGVWGRVTTGALGPEGARYGVIFAFQVLPTIIFIAALFAILVYLGRTQEIGGRRAV